MAEPHAAPVPAPEPESELTLPRHLGDYELLAEIGRGGMGVIYRARQIGLNRPCAVKMLRADTRSASPNAEAALEAEATAAAHLDHPNIVGIYEAGREAGRLFFSMELVDGEDLGRHVRSRLLDAGTIATLMLKIAEAIAYAHERGVMHHDLKPANVVIDPRGEPQITDFGLARRVDEARRTDPTAGAGSPNYLAPEQASARFGEPSFATDVFGIGAILYFLLTDRPPFLGFTPADTIRAALETDPMPPRLIRPGVAPDLETICLKCLAKQPARRYATARDVADELQRFLRDEPIRARPAGVAERVRKFCRRHPAIAALGSLVALLLVLISVGSSYAAVRIHQARQRAESSELVTRRNLYDADLLLASSALAAGNDGQVRELLGRYESHPPDRDLRGWEWRFLRQATRGDVAAEIGRGESPVQQLAFSRNRRWLVGAEVSGAISVWDVERHERLARRQLAPFGIVRFALARQHDWLVAVAREGGTDGTNAAARILELPTLATRSERRVEVDQSALAFSPDDQEFWTAGTNFVVAHPVGGGPERIRHRLPGPVPGSVAAVSLDGRWFAAGEERGGIVVLDLASGTLHGTLPGHAFRPMWLDSVRVLSFSPDGRQLLSAGADGAVRLWNVAERSLVREIRGHEDLVLGAAWSPDGRALASVGRESFVQVAPLGDPGPGSAGAAPVRLRGTDLPQSAVVFLPDGEAVVTGGFDTVIRRWNARARPPVHWVTNLPARTSAAVPLRDARFFAAYLADQGVSVHRTDTGQPVLGVPGAADRAAIAVECLTDGDFVLASLFEGGRISVTRGSRQPPVVGQMPTADLGLVRRGSLLTVDRAGRHVAVAHVRTGLRILELGRPAGGMTETFRRDGHPRVVTLSPGGGYVAIGDVTGAVEVCGLGAHGTAPVTMVHPSISGAEFAPGERVLATTGLDGTACLWDLTSGRQIARLSASCGNIFAAEWSSDATRLFLGSLGGVLSVWDLTTLRETFVQRVHNQAILSLLHAPDGTLISGGPDGLCLWPAP